MSAALRSPADSLQRATLALVGPRGAGKTTLGIALAVRLQWPFADSDGLVGDELGEPAGDYLAREGEPAFRAIEQRVTLAALGHPGVVATGGGAVLSAAVCGALRGPGVFTVWLDADPDALVGRIRRSPQHRPALTDQTLENEVRDLLQRRRSLYEQVADLRLETQAANVDSCCRAVLATMRGTPGPPTNA